VLLVVYAGTVALRRWFVGASFAVVWWSYALASSLALILTWVMTWFLVGAAADFAPGVSATLFGIAAYPLLATFFARAQRTLLR
jgi:rod shape-determining protein MreD